MTTRQIPAIRILLVLPLLVLISCQDQVTPTSIAQDQQSSELLGLTEPVTSLLGSVTTLPRTQPVDEGTCAADVAVGPLGGLVECPEAGLRLEIPIGALDRTVEISVHIPRGDLVGYEFSPHGLEFDRPVRLRQSLEGTRAESNSTLLSLLVGAYVSDIDSIALPLELFPISHTPDSAAYWIDHFSGYIVATN